MKSPEPKLEENLLEEILDEIGIDISVKESYGGYKFGMLCEFHVLRGKKNPIYCRIDINYKLTQVSIYKERKVKEKKPWHGARSWEHVVGVDLRDPSSIDNLRTALKVLQDG